MLQDLAKKTDFDAKLKKINSNKLKHVLVENESKKLQTFDSSYFRGKNNFLDNDGTQNYLILQPINRYFKRIIGVSSGNIFTFGNLKVPLMKGVFMLLNLIIALLQN